VTRLTTAGIIAAYNHEEYVAQAVNHLVDQVDELIVVNDASTDRTAEILESMKYPNLIVIHNDEQSGVSGSYNNAVAVSTADVLLIQGGDDRSLPNRATDQRHVLEDPSVSLVCSLPKIIDGRGRELPDSVAGEFFAGATADDPLHRLFFGANYVCAPSVAIRRSDYVRLGGFRLGLDLLQDFALWLPLAAEGRFVFTERPVVEYRKHPSNLSREYVGLDSVKRRRYAAEMEFIRHHFLSNAGSATLMRLAQFLALDVGWFDALTLDEKVAVIELLHDDKLLVRRGLAFIFDILGREHGLERMRAMRLSLQDLNSLSMRADHENLADVGKALAVSHAVLGISPSTPEKE
jgi:glycosyltransferase involved in cell wall biosynthesis